MSRGAVAITPDQSLEAALAGDDDLEMTGNPAPVPRRGWISFGSALTFALSGLALIGLSTAIERSITSLFDENAWLGGVASALAGLAALALLGLLGRETLSILRQRRITALREEAARLRDSREVAEATA
ncbi:MAG: TIGR01620 family protein, partial [Hyphomicrobiales bacterium]|nr:TIGR01620 family protein [Hyphomicrobiales bacterium]